VLLGPVLKVVERWSPCERIYANQTQTTCPNDNAPAQLPCVGKCLSSKTTTFIRSSCPSSSGTSSIRSILSFSSSSRIMSLTYFSIRFRGTPLFLSDREYKGRVVVDAAITVERTQKALQGLGGEVRCSAQLGLLDHAAFLQS